MFNTVILKKGYARLTNEEYKHFSKGDTIFGNDRIPEEIERWNIEEKEKAIKELNSKKCNYEKYNEYLWEIEEYALEYCECDENGEFVEGSDIDFATEKA